jgi:hypothetical protein
MKIQKGISGQRLQEKFIFLLPLPMRLIWFFVYTQLQANDAVE